MSAIQWGDFLCIVSCVFSSHFAKLLNLPRPPGEGRDHEEVSSASVVVEKEAESPISVQITGRRLVRWSGVLVGAQP